jgi:hypothetical protein
MIGALLHQDKFYLIGALLHQDKFYLIGNYHTISFLLQDSLPFGISDFTASAVLKGICGSAL